jgi:nucleoside-diphosphate-sugar epimerase
LEKKAKIKYLPRHPADVTATWANINKAKNLLSWNPKINIEDGIQKTVNWFEENWGWVKEINI